MILTENPIKKHEATTIEKIIENIHQLYLDISLNLSPNLVQNSLTHILIFEYLI
jgi:hypothetical protein